MTPEHALNIVMQIADQYRGTRKEHDVVSEAIRVLSALVKKDAGQPVRDANGRE